MSALLLSLALAQATPAASAPQVDRASVMRPSAKPALRPSRFALHFTPLTLFALSVWVEGDLHLAGGVSVFVNVGGGALKQLGGDAGLRFSSTGSHLEGFYFDLRGSTFGLPEFGMWMAGPGLQLGYSWKFDGFALALGVGLTTFFLLDRGAPNATFLDNQPVATDFFILAGVGRPGPEQPAVMPALRVAIGPWF